MKQEVVFGAPSAKCNTDSNDLERNPNLTAFAWAFVVNSICPFDRGRYGVLILQLFLGLPQIAAIHTISV